MSVTDIDLFLTGSASNEIQYECYGGVRSATPFVNNSQDNLFRPTTYDQSVSGDYMYECLNLYNDTSNDLTNARLYFLSDGYTTVSNDYTTGSVNILVSDSTVFADPFGYVSNEVTDEVFFYNSVSNDYLCVDSAHRGLRGTVESAGTSNDLLCNFPWIDMAWETDASNEVQTIANTYTAPSLIQSDTCNGAWVCPVSVSNDLTGYSAGVKIGVSGEIDADFDASNEMFLWTRLNIPAGVSHAATVDVSKLLKISDGTTSRSIVQLKSTIEREEGYYIKIHYVNDEATDTEQIVSTLSPYVDISSVTYPAEIDISVFKQGKLYRNEDPDYVTRITLDASGAIVDPIPNVPGKPAVQRLAGGKFMVSWTYNPTSQQIAPDSYELWADSGSGYALVTTTALKSYRTAGYADSTTVYFKVRAKSATAYSDYSAVTSAIAATTNSGSISMTQITRSI